MTDEKHIIWSNYHLDYADWKEDLEAEYPDLSENERVSLMYEINDEYLDDEIARVYGFSIPQQRQAAALAR